MTEHSPDKQIETPTPDTRQETAEFSAWGELFDGIDVPPFVIVDPQRMRVSHEQDSASHTHRVLGADYVEFATDIVRASTVGIALFPDIIERMKQRLPAMLDQARDQVRAVMDAPGLGTRQAANYYSGIPGSLRRDLGIGDDIQLLFERLADAPDDALSDFLLWNTSHIHLFSAENQPLLDAAKLRFTRNMETAIRRGLPVSQEQLRTRLEDSRMYMVDPMSGMLESFGGYYVPHLRTVHVAASVDTIAVNGTISHELMHLVSGAKLEKATHPDFPDMPELTSVIVSRCGLANRDGGKAPAWINEAITEQLSRLLLHKMPRDFKNLTNQEFFEATEGVYQYERVVLKHLLGNHVSIPGMLGAYFEDTTPQNEDILPLTELFWRQIEAKFGNDIHAYLASAGHMQSTAEWRDFVDHLKQMYAQNLLAKGLRDVL